MNRYQDDDEDEAGAVCGQPSPERSGVVVKEGRDFGSATSRAPSTIQTTVFLAYLQKRKAA